MRVDTGWVVTDCCNSNSALISPESTGQRTVLTLSFECYSLKFLDKKDFKILRQALPPLRLPSRLPDVTHVTLSPRPSPSVFAYRMRSKTGGGNGLGTRLVCKYVYVTQNTSVYCIHICICLQLATVFI